MKDDNERSVKVGSIGMDERSRAALSNAFEAYGNEALVLVKDEEPADVTVIDLDGPGADHQWLERQDAIEKKLAARHLEAGGLE